MYKATILKLKHVRPHPNADRVQLATCHGNQVVVGLNAKEGDLGVYFPSDGQICHEYIFENNLYRDSTFNKDASKTGMFDKNRRVRAQRFRGEISDGFWMPIESLSPIVQTKGLEDGFEFDELDGTKVCNKYINAETLRKAQNRENNQKKVKVARSSIMFKEHFDTDHFGKHISEIRKGEELILTEKTHGSSHRIGHVLVDRKLNWFERILLRLGVKIQLTEWIYLNGTRRVVLRENIGGSSFHDPSIRVKAAKEFEGLLRKGETVYLEIVGFEPGAKSIMPKVKVDKKVLPEIYKKYGKSFYYSYGCEPEQCDIYVYRMTMTSLDGVSFDYPWDTVVARCNEIGVKHVPEIARIEYDGNEAKLLETVDQLSKGPSIIDGSHIKEGSVVRINNRSENVSFKHKTFEFKFLEGIIKDSGVVDAEEVESESK